MTMINWKDFLIKVICQYLFEGTKSLAWEAAPRRLEVYDCQNKNFQNGKEVQMKNFLQPSEKLNFQVTKNVVYQSYGGRTEQCFPMLKPNFHLIKWFLLK